MLDGLDNFRRLWEKTAVYQNEVKYPYFIEIESKIFILA